MQWKIIHFPWRECWKDVCHIGDEYTTFKFLNFTFIVILGRIWVYCHFSVMTESCSLNVFSDVLPFTGKQKLETSCQVSVSKDIYIYMFHFTKTFSCI
jgi:hypothetical protein